MESPKAAMEAGGGGEVGGGAVGTGCAAVNAASTTNGRIRKRATFGTATSFADRRCIPGTHRASPAGPYKQTLCPRSCLDQCQHADKTGAGEDVREPRSGSTGHCWALPSRICRTHAFIVSQTGTNRGIKS